MPISALPSAPLPTDTQASFNTKAFAWVAALDTWTTQANTQATQTNLNETNSLSYKNLALDWASKVNGIIEATDYSAKAWAIGGTGVTTTSGASKEWATKIDGAVITGQYSSKAWSIGGTGITEGASKEWATKIDGAVITGQYSSKAWSIGGTGVTDAANAGAAKEWAIKQSGAVDGIEFSAKYYSVQSSIFAAAAASASNAQIWISGTAYLAGDVRYSPIDFQSYRRKISGAGTTDPSADTTNWTQISGGGDVDGPAGAIDGQLAGFDGVTGKLIKAISSATQAEMEAGVVTALRGMSPENIKQAILALTPPGTGLAKVYFMAQF